MVIRIVQTCPLQNIAVSQDEKGYLSSGVVIVDGRSLEDCFIFRVCKLFTRDAAWRPEEFRAQRAGCCPFSKSGFFLMGGYLRFYTYAKKDKKTKPPISVIHLSYRENRVCSSSRPFRLISSSLIQIGMYVGNRERRRRRSGYFVIRKLCCLKRAVTHSKTPPPIFAACRHFLLSLCVR